jgi:hypothetical protein
VGAVHPTTQREAAITTTTQPAPARTTVGVGPHAEAHAAVANDGFGRRQDTTSVATTPAADAGLLGWARRLGQVEAWGIEGTGSFGAGLTRFSTVTARSWSRSTVPTGPPGAGAARPTRWTPGPPPEPSRLVRAPSQGR